ncbi:MAG: hypothetical protein IKP40_08795 [Clostridia bacterium]|nr:hypothetical protein [Clostridia bacterium]
MGKKLDLSSKSDMKRFAKELEKAAVKEAEKQIRRNGIEVECPNCHAKVTVKPDDPCPSCGTLIRFDVH